MTRWLIAGAGGMLGRDLMSALAGHDAVGLTRAQLDITEPEAVEVAVAQADVVLNAAAWTDVDGAESDPGGARAANALGPAVLAEACARHGARLLHLSTDYVFDGGATRPYREMDPTGPRTQYGLTKVAGERAVLASGGYVVRTAWLYGRHGPNFVRTMLELERTTPEVDVVDDQWGQPTWTRDLAARLLVLGEAAAAPGVYHVSGSGRTTWYGLARAVFAAAGADPARVRRTTTARFPRPAPRPAFSVLDHGRMLAAGLAPMPAWEDALREAVPVLAAVEV